MAKLNRFLASRWGIISAGAVVGILAPILQKLGNPGNMGICVACFERDIAGALGLHRAAVVQYIRPEIPGFILGALIAALIFGEFRPRSGSAPIVRFFLGVFAMIGALVFLGCPWRALLRLAGGDWNAIVALWGLSVGIGVGVLLLRRGYTLGRSYRAPALLGWIMPGVAVVLLLMAILRPQFSEDGAIFFSESGPGSLHAPLSASLAAGAVIGVLAQRTRLCTMGAIRDVLLMGDTHLFGGVAAIVVFAFFANLILGQFDPGFVDQPVAHNNHLWNFGGMVLAGLAFALSGGCPGRQLFLAGEGDGDAGVFVLGMIAGAALAHNFSWASSPAGPGAYGPAAVIIGLVACLAIGLSAGRRA